MPPTPAARDLATVPSGRAPTSAHAKGLAIGALLVLGGLAVVWATGALSTGELLACGLGAAVALFAVAAVALLQPRLLRHVATARSPGTHVQLTLAIAMLFKLLGLTAGVVALVVAGVKFSGIAAFAVSFAAASLVLQVCNAALSTRACARAVPDTARPDPLP